MMKNEFHLSSAGADTARVWRLRLLVLILAGSFMAGCARIHGNQIPMYGSHFYQDSWLPAQSRDVSQAPSYTYYPQYPTTTSTPAPTGTVPTQTDVSSSMPACNLMASHTAVVGQPLDINLAMSMVYTYLAQFASWDDAFQLTGISGSNGNFKLRGYFNQSGSIVVAVAVQNSPDGQQGLCQITVQVSDAVQPNQVSWYTNYYPPPWLRYWPEPLPMPYSGQQTIINGNGNTVNNTTVNNNTTVYNPPAPTPAPTPAPQPAAPSPVVIYRSHIVINRGGSIYEDYLYSQNPAEGSGAYTLEGPAFLLYPNPYGDCNIPFTRCLANNGQQLPYHFMSVAVTSGNQPTCEGQRVEGAIGFVCPGQVAGSTQLYRIFNSRTGAHLTTKNWGEVQAAVNNGGGWGYEGPQGFAF